MKLLVNTTFLSTAKKEIWTKRSEFPLEKVQLLIEKNRLIGRGIYQSVHTITSSGIIYPYLFIDVDAEDLERDVSELNLFSKHSFLDTCSA